MPSLTTMKGGTRKCRKRKMHQQAEIDNGISDNVSSPISEELSTLPASDLYNDSQSINCSSPRNPKTRKRRKGQTQDAFQTSTPVRRSSRHQLPNISTHTTKVKRTKLDYPDVMTNAKASAIVSPGCKSNSQRKLMRDHSSQLNKGRKTVPKKQTQTCNKTSSSQTKRRYVRKQKTEKGDLRRDSTSTRSSQRSRPRFESEEVLTSSDTSIELSHHEVQLPCLSFVEDEESCEEEELPSFLMQAEKQPPSIREGVFVWCKFRNFPFWPALVKSVYRKMKKASVIFIDHQTIHRKKGFTVALKTLKHFECEGAHELVCKAKEMYEAAIEWSLDLIKDYSIRIACGSFSGSFIEYFAHDMSYPVRKKYPQAPSERLTIADDSMMEDQCDDVMEDSLSEQQEGVIRSSKRLLPDRTHAAHNRANEKLVHFIVKQRMAEGRLLAVIRGQEQSRWLRSFQIGDRRRVVNIYLEDEQQLDQVYCYLSDLYATAVATSPCSAGGKFIERVPFVLDVLLPEAIICAIAGVDNVSVKKAEEKYLKGRCISNRERQEFDLMIERQMRRESQHQKTKLSTFQQLDN
ncbi:PWWP domain-containing DNA repair factor 3A-like [Aulostomus maculatus]